MKRSFPALVFAVGLETLVSGRIPALVPREFKEVVVSSSALTAYHDIKQTEIPDPLGHRHLLGPHEFIVPDKVMQVDDAQKGRAPAAGFFLDETSLYDSGPLIGGLQKAGYSEHDAWWYYGVLTTIGNIVISEETFQSLYFREILVHERLHKRIPNLPHNEHNILSDAYNKLHQRNIIPEVFFAEVKKVGSNPMNEFYPALVGLAYGFDDLMGIKIEEILFKDYPAAYHIFDHLRNEEKQRVGLMK
ncbi:MAG: hypothetical protein Q7R76_00285 [Candidatus Woesearchaeota archaeon]|nr:hypothetical protein [Candidatus Woesearchaeota archaeon]